MTMHRMYKLLIFIVLFLSYELAEAEPYTREAKISCGQGDIMIQSECRSDENPMEPNCMKQNITFYNNDHEVVATAQYNENKINQGINALAYKWTCTRTIDDKKSYLIVRFSAAVSCSDCERVEIFDANGKRLAIDNGNPNNEKVKTLLTELGLRKWGSLKGYVSIPLLRETQK